MSRVPIAALALCLLTVSCAVIPDAEPTPFEVFTADPAALLRGKGLFIGMCGGYCHARKPGNRAAPDLFDCTWKHGGSPDEIFATISNGVPPTQMMSYGGKLPEGDDDIWKIIAFLKTDSRCETGT